MNTRIVLGTKTHKWLPMDKFFVAVPSILMLLIFTAIGCTDSQEADSQKKKVVWPVTHRYERGQFVEHFLLGKAMIISRTQDSETHWPLYTIYYRDNNNLTKRVYAWEHEIKPLVLADYPARGQSIIESEVDIETQLMEERIEEQVLERLSRSPPNDKVE